MKALVGAFSVIVKTGCGSDGSFYSTRTDWSKIWAEGLTKSDMAVHGCAELSLYDTVCNILLLLMRPNVSPPSVHNHIFRCNGDNYWICHPFAWIIRWMGGCNRPSRIRTVCRRAWNEGYPKVSTVSYSRPSCRPASQFHVYLPWGQCPFSIVS